MRYTDTERNDRLIEYVACNSTRGALEEFASTFNYTNVRKMNRHRLEGIAFIGRFYELYPEGRYRVFLHNGVVLRHNISAKSLIDYIFRWGTTWIFARHGIKHVTFEDLICVEEVIAR